MVNAVLLASSPAHEQALVNAFASRSPFGSKVQAAAACPTDGRKRP